MSAQPKFPDTLIVQPERIPAALKEGRKHVAWRWPTDNRAKPTKLPINPDTGNLADATAPSTWATFEDALAYMQRNKLPGLGRVMTPTDDIAGIDLDHCVNPETGEIEPWALAIIAMFAPTYCEYSPSGTGIRIFLRGRLDGAGCKVGDIEIYDQGRYLTMTGHPIPGAADTVAERQDALAAFYRQLQADRVTTPAAPMEFTANLDAEGARILQRLCPQEPGERLRRGALTERIWKIAHGDDAILKPTKDGLVPYEGESERRYAVVCALYDVGLKDDEVRAVFKATARWQRCVADHGEKDAERRLTQQDMPNAKGFIGKQREEAAAKEREEHFAGDPETSEMLPLTLPTIDAGNRDLPDVTRQAWAALEAANDPPRLFRHAGGVARLDVDEDGRPVLRPVTTRTLRHEVAKAADWYVVKKYGPEPAVPPQHVTENMLEVPAPPVPLLERIAHAPFFAPDWTLVMEPGYHAASRSYLIIDDLHLAPIPATPSGDDLRQARDLILNELFADFPFVGDPDRANAVALALLPYARPAITGATPLHLIEASTPGTGKGLLADVATRPAVGTHVGVMTQPHDSDEMRKRLTARLREGAPVILLDNIVHTLASGDLAAALTADTWTDRILGSTETINVPVRCVWVGSGNNVTMTTELARRLIRIRLDAMTDRPWQRTGFRHENLIKWADEHRADLVHAALVIIQAWVAAGKPEGKTTLGSFERWAAIMGGILDNAGVAGFCDNLDAFYEEADLEGAIWRQFVGLWWGQHGDKEVTVADLFPLTDAVEGLDLGKGNDKAQRTAFGMLLAKQRDRVFGDYRIVFARVAHKAKMWRLVPIAIKPLIPPDDPAQREPLEKGSPPVSPCGTKENGEGGEPRGTYSNATRGEFSSSYAREDEGQKVPQGSPCGGSSADSPLCGKEKPTGEPFFESPPGAVMSRLELEAWAKDIAIDWGSSPENLARAKAGAKAHLDLTILDDAMEMKTAKLILASLKGAR